MSKRPLQWLVTGLALAVVPACGNPNDLQVEETVGELKADSTSTYFAVRRDLRKCVSPLCGGYYVTPVNGSAAATYVAAIDYHSAGLSSADLTSDPEIVRGSIVSNVIAPFGDLHQLVATEAWDASSSAAASGTFYRLTDKHIACFAAPCFDLHEAKLNATTTAELSGIHAADAQLAADARTAVASDLILVAGTNRSVPKTSGITAKGLVVDISQYYTRVQHKAPSCAGVDCGAGEHCELQTVECFTTPCDPQPVCVADAPFCGGIAGIRCNGNAQCVDNPNDSCDPANGGRDCGGICVCPPNTKLCINGTHWDGSAGVCACVADACPPNTKLCMVGTHYDGTPGVCACVPDATGPACGKNTCAVGQVCCNASCGVCTQPGFACSMIACLP